MQSWLCSAWRWFSVDFRGSLQVSFATHFLYNYSNRVALMNNLRNFAIQLRLLQCYNTFLKINEYEVDEMYGIA